MASLPTGAAIDKTGAMADLITTSGGVTLLGGGEPAPGALAAALSRAPLLVAADGGADRALAAGRVPERVIGDMDSISAAARARLADRLVQVPAQDDTDLDKALDRIAADFVLALGVTGGRLDHTLAAMSSLMRRPRVRAVLWGGEDLCFLLPPRLELALPPGMRLSLYPMAPVRCRGEGLVWPTDPHDFRPEGMIGTSNTVGEGPVRLEPEGPALLCLTPPEALDAVLEGLRLAPSWPGPVRAR